MGGAKVDADLPVQFGGEPYLRLISFCAYFVLGSNTGPVLFIIQSPRRPTPTLVSTTIIS